MRGYLQVVSRIRKTVFGRRVGYLNFWSMGEEGMQKS